ncbi:MAG: hypothetical protein KBA91_03505 [Candidatus Moranbacteria bacterium]|jgi:hypothetical protein|nr:hypothetical protein [Candidatus Moranbacteria bacterium]
MYWIYLIIFTLAVLTPKLIRGGNNLLLEEDIESLFIFCFGALGFMIYLAKEKSFLKVFREKLHLQKQTNMITRDLSDSYSYIGEMNRRLDIVKDFIFSLPKTTALALGKKESQLYASLLQTASELCKTDQVVLCFVHIKKQRMEQVFEKGAERTMIAQLDPASLLSEERFFWEQQDYVVVRSPQEAHGVAAFLIFVKAQNHIEDSDVYKILASQALVLYFMGQKQSSGDRV